MPLRPAHPRAAKGIPQTLGLVGEKQTRQILDQWIQLDAAVRLVKAHASELRAGVTFTGPRRWPQTRDQAVHRAMAQPPTSEPKASSPARIAFRSAAR